MKSKLISKKTPLEISEIIMKDILAKQKKIGKEPFFFIDYVDNYIDSEEDSELFEEVFGNVSNLLDLSVEFALSINEESMEFCHFYLPAAFKGARFCIKPMEDEIDRGIMIPGSRFIPFVSVEYDARDTTVLDGHKRIFLKVESICVEDLESTLNCYPFPLEEYIENDGNTGDIYCDLEGDDEVKIEVYDFSLFYKKHNFKYGDYLVFTLEDFDKRVLSVEYRSFEDNVSDMGSILRWVALMEEGLLRSLEVFSFLTFADEQLSFSFLASDFLRENPVIGIDGFLKLSKKIRLDIFKGASVFMSTDDEDFLENKVAEFENLFDIQDRHQINPDDLNTIDEILRYIGHDMKEDELKAYMYDELYHKRNDFEKAWSRCFNEKTVEFQEFSCLEDNLRILMKEMWKSVTSHYKREEDKAKGRIREKALKINDDHIEWLKNISSRSFGSTHFVNSDFLEIAEMSAFLSSIIVELNFDYPSDINGMKDLDEILNDFRNVFSRRKDEWREKNSILLK